MTVTAVRDALEIERVESHLHTEPSYELDAHPAPTGREETWRFTPLKRLGDVLADGAPTGSLQVDTDLQPGATLRTVDAAEAAGFGGLAPLDRLAALAAKNAEQVSVFEIPADTEIAEPVRIRAFGEGIDGTVTRHTVVRVGRHAKVQLIVEGQGSAHLNEFVQVVVEDGAQVDLVNIYDWADDAVHTAQFNITVGRDALVRNFELTIGGDVVRTTTNVAYAGPGGAFEGVGLYFADAGQHIEHRLFVDHNAPRTKSNVVYKGALQGQNAHTVWIGNVLIRKVAEGIETYEENRNLVLTEGCQADSVPNLEIETGEIEGAGHASTTGRFDDNHLFYLQSRGIEEEEARRLVVHGFFNDIIRRIGVPELQERLVTAIESELAGLV